MDLLRVSGQITFLIAWVFSFALLYYIIKVAVRNGVEQANARLLESVRAIEKTVTEIKNNSK